MTLLWMSQEAFRFERCKCTECCRSTRQGAAQKTSVCKSVGIQTYVYGVSKRIERTERRCASCERDGPRAIWRDFLINIKKLIS